jgi:hypothetical protein
VNKKHSRTCSPSDKLKKENGKKSIQKRKYGVNCKTPFSFPV